MPSSNSLNALSPANLAANSDLNHAGKAAPQVVSAAFEFPTATLVVSRDGSRKHNSNYASCYARLVTKRLGVSGRATESEARAIARPTRALPECRNAKRYGQYRLA